MSANVSINLYKDGLTGGLQVSIDYDRGDGSGHGHRLLGPKFCGESRHIKGCTLTQHDIDALRRYLRIASGISRAKAKEEHASGAVAEPEGRSA